MLLTLCRCRCLLCSYLAQANYGRKDATCEAACKKVFAELDIPTKYAAYEAEFYRKINAMIDAVDESSGLKKEVLRSFLAKVYKRTK